MGKPKISITGLSDKRRYVPELSKFVSLIDAADKIKKVADEVDLNVLLKLSRASEGANTDVEMRANMAIVDLMEEFILTQGITYIIKEEKKQ